MRRLLKFLFGAAIGASAAMLVTPKTGREVRERLLGPEVRKLMPASLAELLSPPEPLPVWPSESAYETATAVAEPEAGVAVAEPEVEVELKPEAVVAEPQPEAEVAGSEEEVAVAEPETEAEAAVAEPAAAAAEAVGPALEAEGPAAGEEPSVVAESPVAEEPAAAEAEGAEAEATEKLPAAEAMVEEPEMAAWSEGGVAEAEASGVAEGTAESAETEQEVVAAPQAVEAPAVTTSQVPMSEEDLRAHIERTKEALTAELEKPFAVVGPEPVATEAVAVEEGSLTQPIGEAVTSAEPAEELAPAAQPEAAEVVAPAELAAAAAPVPPSAPVAEAAPAEPVAEAPGVETVVGTPVETPPPEQAHTDETTAAVTPESDTEARGETSIDQAEMRRRIEETRARLKAKAFDAMMSGKSALLARDSGEKPVPRGEDLPVDHDVASSLEESLSPEDE